MSKDIKEIYTDAKSSIEKDISSYKENTKKISDINEAAKIHLKENLNWYKIKYAKTISSDRKDAILKDVIELFPGADKKVLTKRLTNNFIFYYYEFVFILMFIMICFVFIFNNNTVFKHIIITLSIIPNIMYFTTSYIKTYFTGKLK